VTLTPDTKDWTWVLERRCDECGFDASTTGHESVAALLRANVERWREILARPADSLRRRTRDDRWSPLEYACHVRDVFRLYNERLALMLRDDDPTFPNWDQDVTAVEERYGEQDPAVVADELADAGERLATSFDAVAGDQWSRTGARSDGARFTVDTFARYFVHDPIHHVWDVTGERDR
jgi:hypothetical protein